MTTKKMTSESVLCSCCQRQTLKPRIRKSKLLPGTPLFLCGECADSKREPRGLIILVGRRDGFDAVAEYIKNDRYVGKQITAKEML